MNEQIPSQELTQKVTLAAAAPEPSEEFLTELRLRVENRAGERQMAAQKNRWVAWRLSLAAFLVVGACVLIAGPSNVVATMREALGYIPGFGVVRTTGLRMLAEPVVVTRGGITISINSVIADSTQTWIRYRVSGLNLPQMNAEKSTPDPKECTASPFIRLPNGREVHSIGGGGTQTETEYDSGDQFPPLPENVENATLVFPCLHGMMPGAGPENWEVPLYFVVNPIAPTVFPVQPIDTPSADYLTPTRASQTNPFQQQISIAIDNIVEVEDGFILMGTIRTISDRYRIDPFFDAIEIRDSTGAAIPAEMASVGNEDLAQPESPLTPAKWAYKIQGKYFHGPLTLSLKWITISPMDPITFPMDVGTNPHDGQTWILDRPLNLFGYLADVQSAKYVIREDMGPQAMQGLEFSVRLPDEIEGLQLNYWDPNPQPGLGGTWSSLGDGLKYGKDLIKVGFLTSMPITGTINIAADVINVHGPWTATWNPPVVAGAPSPTPVPDACLTNESWQAIQTGPVPPLPADVAGRFLVDNSPTPGGVSELHLFGLNSLDLRLLQKGVMETDISKDGKELAFVPMDGGLSVLNIDRGEITVLAKDAGISRPLWSPDGQWIAFVTFDNGNGEAKLNIIHPDGTGRREVGIGANGRDLAGWYPDSAALLIQASDDDQIIGLILKKVDLATDTATPIAPNIIVQGAVFSPDGVWVAYQYLEFGRNGPWIYIARLDGSERRLLVKLDGRWSGGDPVWSPDSKWLSFSVTDMQNRDQPFGMNAILNPKTCEVIPLPGVDGAIKSWIS